MDVLSIKGNSFANFAKMFKSISLKIFINYLNEYRANRALFVHFHPLYFHMKCVEKHVIHQRRLAINKQIIVHSMNTTRRVEHVSSYIYKNFKSKKRKKNTLLITQTKKQNNNKKLFPLSRKLYAGL